MKASEYFAINTFSYKTMQEKLPKNVYKKLVDTIEHGLPLDETIAETVAHAMKEWALERGATHFTHWFQPLTRGTAEKHDAFITRENGINGGMIERFSKDQLVQAEPDASSFPSGGMRSTFEARGYTAWDPTSPVFLIENENGTATLCIPSVFLSYTGDSLDKKTPLLRSMKALNKQTKALLELLGKPTERVLSTVGPEQEYFLIPKELYDKRIDLVLTGRTLLGAPSPRGQKLEDHYFGTIPDRALAFMQDLEKEAYKLGIPIKTRHNEVAPSQFELAPIFEDANIANDHNKLLMELMTKIARRHELECLLHEKPFKEVNGSGKHNNWSIMTQEGKNLLEPGESFEDRLDFLLILVTILNAVYKHSRLLRAAIATPGNDFRLGGNEAPPAIISVFLGHIITSILESIAQGTYHDIEKPRERMDLGIEQLPAILRDNTDRNRTSPFAFTGNKFEFRAVGASQSLGFPNAFLNTAVAEAMQETTALLRENLEKGMERNAAILETIKTLYLKAKPIVFNGNNYSEEWVAEAQKRGLPNITNTFDALQALLDPENIELLEQQNVLKPHEIQARYNVEIQRLKRIIEIEANTITYMTQKEIIPATLQYLSRITNTPLYEQGTPTHQLAQTIQMRVKTILQDLDILRERLKEMDAQESITEAARIGVYKIRPHLEKIRESIDQLELCIPSEHWPYPSYIELLHALK